MLRVVVTVGFAGRCSESVAKDEMGSVGNSAEVCHTFITHGVINTGVSNCVLNSTHKNERK